MIFTQSPRQLFLFSGIPYLIEIHAFIFISFLHLVSTINKRCHFGILECNTFSLNLFSGIFNTDFYSSCFCFCKRRVLYCYHQKTYQKKKNSAFDFLILPSFVSFFFVSCFSFFYVSFSCSAYISFSGFCFFFSFPHNFFFLAFFLFFQSQHIPKRELESL